MFAVVAKLIDLCKIHGQALSGLQYFQFLVIFPISYCSLSQNGGSQIEIQVQERTVPLYVLTSVIFAL